MDFIQIDAMQYNLLLKRQTTHIQIANTLGFFALASVKDLRGIGIYYLLLEYVAWASFSGQFNPETFDDGFSTEYLPILFPEFTIRIVWCGGKLSIEGYHEADNPYVTYPVEVIIPFFEDHKLAGWETVFSIDDDIIEGDEIIYIPKWNGLNWASDLWELLHNTPDHPSRQNPDYSRPPRRKKPGFVYLLQSPTRAYKIGRTKSPENRIKTFGIKLPFEIEYVALIKTHDMNTLENQLHSRFETKRVNGEWFALDQEDIDYIKSLEKQT